MVALLVGHVTNYMFITTKTSDIWIFTVTIWYPLLIQIKIIYDVLSKGMINMTKYGGHRYKLSGTST